jgi:Peptidase family C78
VMESSKWIGTTEIFALFSSMKIECVIKDFANGNGDLKQQLFHFVREYFVENLKKGFAAPLYIQYSGHSRTVIGVDVTGLDTPEDPKLMDNVGLLIFDPGQSQWDIKIRGTPTRKWYKNHIYCPVKSFKENTFQILYFTGKILSQAQYEVMKEPGAGHETSAARIYSSSLVTL